MRGSLTRQDATRVVEDAKTGSFRRQPAKRSVVPLPGSTLMDMTCDLRNQQQTGEEFAFDDLYTVDESLRSGSYGAVYKCHHVSDPNTRYAVKILDKARLKQKKDNANVFRELEILRELRFLDHVISLIDFFQDDSKMYMVQVLAEGGDVFDRLSQRQYYTEKDARDLALILLQTVGAIHQVPIVHRDLKPENLLLRYANDDTSILLADFGFARHVRPDEWCQTRCGTPAFVAPEILLGIPYGMRVDLWSIGCLLYMLIGGYPPFQGSNHRELFCKIRAGDFVFHETVFGNVSIAAKNLISHLLTVNMEHRCTVHEALQSDWFQRESVQRLKANDLSGRTLPGFKKFMAQRRWKAAKTAITWAATQPFWKPDQVTFSQQIKTWDKQAIDQQLNGGDQAIGGFPGDEPMDFAEHDQIPTQQQQYQQQQQEQQQRILPTTATPDRRAQLVKEASTRVPVAPLHHIAVPIVKFADVYHLRKRLRSGSSATVWECLHIHSHEIYAVKVIDRRGLKPSDDENVLTEVASMQSLSANRHCVQLLDFYEESDYFYLVMEYMAGGDVFDRIVSLTAYTEKDARDLAKTLLVAVRSMHKANIAHRDIKPQNLLLRRPDDHANVKIGDFGFARRVHTPNSLTSRVGTPTYVAPEILKNIPHDQRVDLWSVGVVIFVLLVGYPPFLEDDQALLFDKIRMGDWTFEEEDWKHISNDAKDLIRGLLVVDPKERMTSDDALRCRWINQDGFSLSSTSLNESMTSIRVRRSRLRALARTVVWFGNNLRPSDNVPTQAQPMDIVQESESEDISIATPPPGGGGSGPIFTFETMEQG
ncbi:hypothetical protein ACA910_002413 [Epithemia clementina (nom. ined.)]